MLAKAIAELPEDARRTIELREIDGLTYVYGGHPNPTRAEGSRAGLLFTPEGGVNNSFLLVSNVDSAGNGGGSDYDEVIAWLQAVEADNANYPTTGVYGADNQEMTNRVLAVTPGVAYDIYGFADGTGQAVPVGDPAPQGGTLLGQAGLPSDIGEVIDAANPVEGNYLEGGFTDGALDSGKGSINGMTMGVIPMLARFAGRAQSGYIFTYAFAMVVGIVVLITWMTLTGGAE